MGGERPQVCARWSRGAPNVCASGTSTSLGAGRGCAGSRSACSAAEHSVGATLAHARHVATARSKSPPACQHRPGWQWRSSAGRTRSQRCTPSSTGRTAARERLVLEGEAGIGKSTLWPAGVEAAQERSFRVLSALDPRRPSRGSPTRRSATSSRIARRRCCPSSRRRGGGRFRPRCCSMRRRLRRSDPRALAVAVHSALLVLAERGPTMIAVDDVQWLDSSSADALSFALRRLDGVPISVLLARRGAQAAPLEHALPGRRRAPFRRTAQPGRDSGPRPRPARPLVSATDDAPAARGLGRKPVLRPGARSRPRHGGRTARSGRAPARAGLARAPRRRSASRACPTRRGRRCSSSPSSGHPLWSCSRLPGSASRRWLPPSPTQVLELGDGEVRFVHPLLASGVDRGGHGGRTTKRAPASSPRSTNRSPARATSRRRSRSLTRRRASLEEAAARTLAGRSVGRGGARGGGGEVHSGRARGRSAAARHRAARVTWPRDRRSVPWCSRTSC